MRLLCAALVVGLTIACSAFAAPALATPTADFVFLPAEPRAGEPVALLAQGSVCDARPCRYRWTEIAPDGTEMTLGLGRSLVVRFDTPGVKAIALTVTNRGFRAPPGPRSASVTKTITVAPPVDTAGPDTTIILAPEETSPEADATFEFVSEPGATFECRLDAGEWLACESPAFLMGLADGEHTFAVRATDIAGNTDATEAVYAWTVDTTPPETTITSGPEGTSTVAEATFEFTSDDGATFECRLDGGEWAVCESPAFVTGLADGGHTFAVRATDAAGHTDATEAVRVWTVTLAPEPLRAA
jgi:hypothetical protein